MAPAGGIHAPLLKFLYLTLSAQCKKSSCHLGFDIHNGYFGLIFLLCKGQSAVRHAIPYRQVLFFARITINHTRKYMENCKDFI